MPGLTVHHLQVGQGERIPFLLEELEIPYTLKLYQRSPVLSPPELKALHPMGASPVLEDATSSPDAPLLLAESGAIVEYIIHKHGNGRLALPPSHPNYADYLYWFHFSNSNLQPTIFRRFAVGSVTKSNPEDPRFVNVDQRMWGVIKHVENRLSQTRYLAGDEFTAADVMSVWCFTTMRKFAPFNLSVYPNILAWLKRCTERPGYRRAMEKGDPDLAIEELISAKGPGLFEAFAKMAGLSK
ncbi:glutathione S-transferase [Clohesyomyces aquaticus]|uniref:Glutathione S-transferase n=1 Tax=Clohesyomyces aquaticus TaxID=1231657 RepID=A0A1Y2AAL9_9PLEO|nr:glutathione S-transferase [Clohesyomyces aquaticus]